MTEAERPNPTQLWLDVLVFSAAIAGLTVWAWEFDQLLINEVGHFGTALAIYGVARIGSRPPFGALSAATIYVAALGLFHFGLTSALAFGIEPTAQMEESTWLWLYTNYAVSGSRLALLGVASCGLGVTLSALFPIRGPVRSIPSGPAVDRALGVAGSAMLVLGVLAWGGILVSRGGLGVFLSSYVAMLQATEGSQISSVYVLINIGVPLLAGTTWRPTHRWGAAAFAVFCVLGFPIGLRGEVLFPLAAALMVRTRMGLRLGFTRLVLIGVVVLAAAALIRDVRELGLGNVEQARNVSANPLNGLMELGSSLRPTVEVVRWYEEGDDYILGQSYLATIDRPLSRFVPWMERIPAEDDLRIMNVLIMERNAGAIGFSPIAEAYRNFGPVGVVLILVLTGFLVDRMDQLPAEPTWNALVGVLMVPLLNQVRNSFISLPAHLLAGLLVVLFIAYYFGAPSRASALRANPQA